MPILSIKGTVYMLGEWTNNLREGEAAWALPEPLGVVVPSPAEVWKRYIECRLKHFGRSADPRSDPPPVFPMAASSRDD
ncbi:MAG TPA: hypothetical protein VGG19_14820 [Tepidisphaeraceae bacterium]